MKIIITESQLKYLIINEDGLLPSASGQFVGYQTQAEGDAFRAWVHQNYPNIAVKNNLSKPPSPYYQSKEIVNVYNTPDPNNKNQTLGYTHMMLTAKQRQQQYYQKLEQQKQLQKIANDYQAQQDAKANQFVAKQDVLDPRKIEGSAYQPSYAQFCITWQKKNPNKPCPQPIQAESALTSGNWQYYIDWFITILEWCFPTFTYAKKLYEIGMAIFHFYSGYVATTVTDSVTNFLNGFSYIAGVLGKKIPLPNWLKTFIAKIEKLFGGSGLDSIGEKLLSKTGEKISSKFANSAKWVQVLVMVIVDLAGDFISWLINSLITYILDPINNYISQYVPNIGKYIKIGTDWLKLINEFIDTGKKIKKVSEVETIYKEVKGLVMGS